MRSHRRPPLNCALFVTCLFLRRNRHRRNASRNCPNFEPARYFNFPSMIWLKKTQLICTCSADIPARSVKHSHIRTRSEFKAGHGHFARLPGFVLLPIERVRFAKWKSPILHQFHPNFFAKYLQHFLLGWFWFFAKSVSTVSNTLSIFRWNRKVLEGKKWGKMRERGWVRECMWGGEGGRKREKRGFTSGWLAYSVLVRQPVVHERCLTVDASHSVQNSGFEFSPPTLSLYLLSSSFLIFLISIPYFFLFSAIRLFLGGHLLRDPIPFTKEWCVKRLKIGQIRQTWQINEKFNYKE